MSNHLLNESIFDNKSQYGTSEHYFGENIGVVEFKKGIYPYTGTVTPSDGSMTITSMRYPNGWPYLNTISCNGALEYVYIPQSVSANGYGDAFQYSYIHKENFINKSSCSSDTNWSAVVYDEKTDEGLYMLDNVVVTARDKTIASITIPSTVTAINGRAFYGCSGLTSIVIPDSVKSIGPYAFQYCTGLTSVTLGNSLEKIGLGAFSYCSNLKTISIPDSVTAMSGGVFNWCNSLTSATLSNSLTEVPKDTFSYCKGLLSIDIPDSVTSIGANAFYQCTGMSSVTFGKSLTNIGARAFDLCTKLSGDIDLSNVTTISDSAFSYCTSVKNVTLGNKLTYIGNYSFENCWDLSSASIPDSVTYLGYDAFSHCHVMSAVTLGTGLTSLNGYAFYGCSALTYITIGKNITSLGNYAFYGATPINELYLRPTTPPVTYARTFACYWNNQTTSSSIKAIYVPYNSVASYKASKYFSGYTSKITYSVSEPIEYNTLSISAPNVGPNATSTTITYVYTTKCIDNVTGGYVNNVIVSGTAESEAFEPSDTFRTLTITYSDHGLSATTTISQGYASTIPYSAETSVEMNITEGFGSNYLGSDFNDGAGVFGFDGAISYIPGYSFSGTALTNIEIPSTVTGMGDYVFNMCTQLESCSIPDSVVTMGVYDFRYASAMTRVNISKGLDKVPEGTFVRCYSLSDVEIPDNIKAIEYNAFHTMKSLTEINIPDSVSGIGTSAFYDSALKKATIGTGMKTINSQAFKGSKISELIMKPTTPPSLNSNAFSNTPITSSTESAATIYVPADSLESYRSATTWSTYAVHIKASEDL